MLRTSRLALPFRLLCKMLDGIKCALLQNTVPVLDCESIPRKLFSLLMLQHFSSSICFADYLALGG